MENQPLITSLATTDGGKQEKGYAPLLATVSSTIVLFGLVIYGGGYHRDSSRFRAANVGGDSGSGGLDLSAVLPPSTCGSCYGAFIYGASIQTESQCCKTCEDVVVAYEVMGWPPPRQDRIVQCNNNTLPHPADEIPCGSCYGAPVGEANCCTTCDEVKQAYQYLEWPPNDGEAIPLCDITAVPTESPTTERPVPPSPPFQSSAVPQPPKCGSCYGTDQQMRCCNTCDDVQKAFNSFPSNIVSFHKHEIPQCGGTQIINGKSPLGFTCEADDDCMNGNCLSTNLFADDDGHGLDPNNSLLCSYHEY